MIYDLIGPLTLIYSDRNQAIHEAIHRENDRDL